MSIGPSDAARLSLWEYEALLDGWNRAHGTGDVQAPSAARAQAMMDRINSDPRLTGAAPVKA